MLRSAKYTVIAFCLGMVLLEGCADSVRQSGTQPSSVPTAPASTGQTSVSTLTPPSDWASDGQLLIAHKEGSDADSSALNAAPYAYASRPINVSSDGTYSLYFGPLDSSSEPAVSKVAVFDFPKNISFSWKPAFDTPGKIVSLSGSDYYEMTYEFTNVAAPYDDLTVWLY
jgi:hypothetical protein